MLLQVCDAGIRVACTRHALIGEGTRHDGNSQCAKLACALSDHGCCTRARAAAHTGRDEHHVRTAQSLDDLLTALRRSCLADLGTRAGTESARALLTDLNAYSCLRLQESLCIRIDCNELNALQTGVDHVIYRIAAAAAYTDNDDLCKFFKVIIHFEHSFSLHIVCESFLRSINKNFLAHFTMKINIFP